MAIVWFTDVGPRAPAGYESTLKYVVEALVVLMMVSIWVSLHILAVCTTAVWFHTL